MRKKPLALIGALVLAFLIGIAAPALAGLGTGGAASADAEWSLPVAAQRAWFPPVGEYETDGETLDDEKFDALLAAFEDAMAAEETLADFQREAEVHTMNFIRRLAPSRVTDEQKERIADAFAALAERHPEHQRLLDLRLGLAESYSNPMGSMPSLSGSLVIFGDADEYDTGGAVFADAQLDDMLARVDAAMNMPETLGDFEGEARTHFWRLNNRLQKGRLSAEQVERVAAFYEEAKAAHPDAAEMIDRHVFVVRNLIPGNVAPNITGTDTEGAEFSLEEYRGNIVAVIFTGQWCGPCRGEYPYHRFVLENYGDRPIVLLGVNSDAKLETARQAKIDERLPYRTWWDGHGQPDAEVAATQGPIATAWNVTGWPAIYILDEEGVIRYVGKRGGEFIAALDELHTEMRMRNVSSAPRGIVIPASRPVPARRVN